ncbi:hypothetical protein R69658_05411 [Paraburkholderia aspalathi]|uniref:Peptidase S24/S26A/S26B/S26C domain-containing protein n=1 Tax=Paraburkholderia aspalathi TaxID=1324617 RepID=A0ABM8SI38_9BURK|nr:S24 family peptidase [Paraburkholderia aspalathi]CAE6811188.1 hypothetical protein R69658_05411 [Paraburkholderia aspalathi]
MERNVIPWDRIAARLTALGKRPAWLATELRTGTNTITNWKTRGGAPLGRARDIAAALDWSIDELMADHASIHHTKSSREAYNEPHAGDNFTAGPDIKPRFYPEISWVQAGMWTEIADNFVLAEDARKYQCHIDLGDYGFVLRVDGVSMTAPSGVFPTFPPGMLLFVRPYEDALPGKFVIVRRNGNTATFKKLIQIEGELFLEALNPDWPHRFMRVQNDDVFCGVVMHAGFDL